MTRPDPHEGHVSGRPCLPTCKLCNAARPEVRPVDAMEGARRDAYEAGRGEYRRLHPNRVLTR